MFESLLGSTKSSPYPGPKELVSGDSSAGYYGTLPGSQLITGNSLATLIGLSVGTALNTDTDWIKFLYKSKILYVPKLPIRVHVSWDNINACGAVFGTGPSSVTIGGLRYKVRLMKGSKQDPYNGVNDAADDPSTFTSEYNELMYRVCSVNPPSQTLPNLMSFTPEELGMFALGGIQLCQEQATPSGGVIPPGVLCRCNGATNISTSHSPASSYFDKRGWRPVLEAF